MKEAEIRAVDAARDLLGDVPGLQVESVEYERKIGRDNAVDGLVLAKPRLPYVTSAR